MENQRTISLTIDGKQIFSVEGRAVLEAAMQNDCAVPHLCFDEKLSPNAHCGLCTALTQDGEVVRLCQTPAKDGQEYVVKDAGLDAKRREELKKILDNHRGDCIAPCRNACPAGTDCQGYVALIANGRDQEAVRLIKQSYPLPATLALTCSRPCERACRRREVDEVIPLAALKFYVARKDLESDQPYLPELPEKSGFSVAVIGAGPAGVSAAWFLAMAGHCVRVYDREKHPGGLLRTKISEEKLPRHILDREIEIVEMLGVEFVCGVDVGTELSYEDLLNDYDAVLIAAGNQDFKGDVEAGSFGAIRRSGDGSIETDAFFRTSVAGIYACGDVTRTRSKMAVEVISEAQKAVKVMNAELAGLTPDLSARSYVSQHDLTAENIIASMDPRQREYDLSNPRVGKKLPLSCGGEDIGDWARDEASRCLECGCLDLYECELLKLADDFNVGPYEAKSAKSDIDKRHHYIFIDQQKCIGCGLCVKACSELMGNGCLELDTSKNPPTVAVAGRVPLQKTYCVGCGQCVAHCPTGALTEHNPRKKSVAVSPELHDGICNYCGVGCSTTVHTYGNTILNVKPRLGGSLPENILCRHGRFGWEVPLSDPDLLRPMSGGRGQLVPDTWESVSNSAVGRLRDIQREYGPDAVGVIIADRMTTEEIYLAQKLARDLGTSSIYSANSYDGGLEEVFGLDGSTNTYRELKDADVIFVIGADVPSYYAMLGVPVRQAVSRGARLLLAAADGWNGFNFLAHRRAVLEDDTGFLKQVLKQIVLMRDSAPAHVTGWDAMVKALESVEVGETAREFAEEYFHAKRGMIMIDRERVSAETVRLVAAIAVASGHIGSEGNGIIQMLQHSNTQTVSLFNIRKNQAKLEADVEAGLVKALVLVGQFVPEQIVDKIEYFLMLDSMKGPALAYADAFLPMPGYGAVSGSYINAEGRVQQFEAAIDPPSGKDGHEVLAALIEKVSGKNPGALEDIRKLMADDYPLLKGVYISGDSFLLGSPVRYANAFVHEDGCAHLHIPQEKAPLFANMVFADAPLVTWFGCLVSEGMLSFS